VKVNTFLIKEKIFWEGGGVKEENLSLGKKMICYYGYYKGGENDVMICFYLMI